MLLMRVFVPAKYVNADLIGLVYGVGVKFLFDVIIDRHLTGFRVDVVDLDYFVTI